LKKSSKKTFIQLVPCLSWETWRLIKLTKFFCFFLFTKRRLFSNILILFTIVSGGH